IEAQYGKAQRIWVMDRGIPTEDVLREMRLTDPPISYLVGTPKGRLTKMEKALLARPWQAVREGVDVKLLAQEEELYVLARSSARVAKERARRRRKLKMAMGAAQRAFRHEPDPRGVAHEARRGARQGVGGLAHRRRRSRPANRQVRLCAQPQ